MSIDGLIIAEEERFTQRMQRSRELHEQASQVLPGGVCSSWASSRPQPVWVSHGEGAYVWDADGTRYIDMHGGYGVNVVGHANPFVAKAVQDRVMKGTHFAQPTEDAIVVAEALRERFGYDAWILLVTAPELKLAIDGFPFDAADAARQPYIVFCRDTAIRDELAD